MPLRSAAVSRLVGHDFPPPINPAVKSNGCTLRNDTDRKVCRGCMALITALVLCARSRDFVISVSVRTVHVAFLTAGFKGGRKPCIKTLETTALRRGI